jgi:hypothetical protein
LLSKQEITNLHNFLIQDIKEFKLSKTQSVDRINFYIENISGLEIISENELQKLVEKIIDNSKIKKFLNDK